MTLDHAVLEIDADLGDGSGTRTGVFTLLGNVEVAPQVEVSYIFEGAGSALNAVFGGYFEQSGTTRRRGVFLDLGAGSHIYEISFQGWEGSSEQWGDTGNTGTPTAHDATGANALTQIQVLNHYLKHTTTDSVNPARLYVGEYTDGTYAQGSGLFGGPLDVAVQGPQNVRASDSISKFDGTMTCVEVEDLDSVQDAIDRLPF